MRCCRDGRVLDGVLVLPAGQGRGLDVVHAVESDACTFPGGCLMPLDALSTACVSSWWWLQ